MSPLVKMYLSDIRLEDLQDLQVTWGIDETQMGALLDMAALSRLAFSTLMNSTYPPPSPPATVPEESILSQTRYGMQRGRPKTAEWAFWAAYLIRRTLKEDGKACTFESLSKFIERLLNRNTLFEKEVRTEFGKIRRKAKNHATVAAKVLLDKQLHRRMKDEGFERWIRTPIEKQLKKVNPLQGEDKTSQFQLQPVGMDGKIHVAWIKKLVKIRRAILNRVAKKGVLTGEEPDVWISPHEVLITTRFLGDSSPPAGTIHLDKCSDVDLPHPKIEGRTINVSVPNDSSDMNPYAATLVSLPIWWEEWQQGLSVFTYGPQS